MMKYIFILGILSTSLMAKESEMTKHFEHISFCQRAATFIANEENEQIKECRKKVRKERLEREAFLKRKKITEKDLKKLGFTTFHNAHEDQCGLIQPVITINDKNVDALKARCEAIFRRSL